MAVQPAQHIQPLESAYWREDDLTSLSTEFDNCQAPTPELRDELWELLDTAQGYTSIEHFLLDINTEKYDPVRLLLDTNGAGQNFLHYAATKGDYTVMKALTSQIVFPTRHPPTPRYVVVLKQHLPLQQDKNGNTPLHTAAANGHLDFAKALIRFHEGGAITDPIDVDKKQVVQYETVWPLMEPADEPYTDVDRRTYTYINIKNHAGRFAWEEAQHVGATDAGIWLEQYWRQSERIWQAMLQHNDAETTHDRPY